VILDSLAEGAHQGRGLGPLSLLRLQHINAALAYAR
jgi:hypothetical protein